MLTRFLRGWMLQVNAAFEGVRRKRASARGRAGFHISEGLEARVLLTGFIQEDFRVPDVEAAFANLSVQADLLGANHTPLTPDGEVIPTETRDGSGPDAIADKDSDEHYQGIARSIRLGTPYLYETGSGAFGGEGTEKRANMLVIQMGARPTDGEILGTNRFTERVDDDYLPDDDRIVNNIFFDDYGHAGGMDILGDILAVSLERPLDADGEPTEDTSIPHGVIRFYDISDPANPRLIEGVEIIAPFFSNPYDGAQGEAGVVALTRLDDGKFFVAMSAKNGVDVIFYKSNGNDFLAEGFNFGELRTEMGEIAPGVFLPGPYQTTQPFDFLHSRRTGASFEDYETVSIGPLPTPWPVNYIADVGFSFESIPNSHQNFNFITQTDGELYLIGSRNDNGGNSTLGPISDDDDADDYIDLYHVTFVDDRVVLEHVATKLVETKDGHFAHVGGSHVSPTGELIYYSGYGYNPGGDDFQLRIGEIRDDTMTESETPIRGIVATTEDGYFSKLSRSGSAVDRYIEAGNTSWIEENGEYILQIQTGATVSFDGNVIQAWIDFYEDSYEQVPSENNENNPLDPEGDIPNRFTIEIDDRDQLDVLRDFGRANDTNNSEFNDDAELASYWLPRGTYVNLYEDDNFDFDNDPTKLGELYSLTLLDPTASEVAEMRQLPGDVRGEVSSMSFFRAGQSLSTPVFGFDEVIFPFDTLTTPTPIFEWSSVIVSGQSTPVQNSASATGLDRRSMSVTFDGGGRHQITFRYLPAGGLIADTTYGELAAARHPGAILALVNPVFGIEESDVVPSDWAEFTITVDVLNGSPTAIDDLQYRVTEDTPLVIATPGVLSNDTDPEGDSITAVLTRDVQHGTLMLNPDGSFTYTPDENFFGGDSFQYLATDGFGNSNVATVLLPVLPANDAPTANASSFNVNEDTQLSDRVTGNDAEGDVLTFELVSEPANASLFTFNSDGTFDYQGALNFYGSDSFSFRAYDGELYSEPATVTIEVLPVNDAPTADSVSFFVNEDELLTDQLTGSDVEGTTLTYELVSGPSNASVFELNSDGTFTYRGESNFNGTDMFTFRSFDGELYSEVATVTVNLLPVNDAPVATDDAYILDEDTVLNVAAGPGVLANDVDIDGNALTAVLVTGPSNGTLTLNADGSFVYTPNPDFNGSDSFTYKANDGALDSNTVTVSLTVNAVNDAPVATADSFETNEDTPLVVSAPGLLSNDTDVEGDALTAVLVTGPTNGTLNFNSDGSFSYVPNLDFSGIDSFTYVANDGQADSTPTTVTIDVVSGEDQIRAIISMIRDLGLNRGRENSLVQKLDHAIRKSEDDQKIPAANMLNAFINEVRAFIAAGNLTAEDGQSLIDKAESAFVSVAT